MSTVSGFLVGLATAAALTVAYSGRMAGGLELAVQQLLPEELALPVVVKEDLEATAAVKIEPVEVGVGNPGGQQLTLEQRWKDFSAVADSVQVSGEFPWRACFRRAAASHDVPESLLLALASGESNFDPAARSDKDAIGLMQIRWPTTSRHLGVQREADLYDPCTNVDAGARYLAELTGKFDENLHLAVAAYNYGPGRIKPGAVPEGASWYSQYIYQHLQQILGQEHIATSELIRPEQGSASGYMTLMRFNRPQRARDFIVYLRGEVPDIELQQRSETLGQHEVVLLYQGENERQRALEAIGASGVATLNPKSTNKLSL